ncbi:MAG: hypothetical protein E7266_08850 [Lachnospiraceae bacterium]|nr:hypothetical protein [Lachnospiraceae bacterium]
MPPLNGNDVQKRVQDAQKKIVEFWKKYDKKQKALIIGISLAVVVALIVLAVIISKPNYKELITCDDSLAAAEVKAALDEGGFDYDISNNGLTFSVKEEDFNNATYLIAQGGYTASGYDSTSIDDALGGGFSSTSEDKKKLYQKYLEDKMKAVLEGLDFISEAKVTFSMPDSKLSILDDEEETSVAVTLKLKSAVPEGSAASMANYIKVAVGNETTDNIIIIDSMGNSIFHGGDDTYKGTNITQVMIMEAAYTQKFIDNITKLVARIPFYQAVAVSPNVKVENTNFEETKTVYENDDEIKFSDYIYELTSNGDVGGIPGTDSNDDETSYYIPDSNGGTTELVINENEYAVSSTITHTKGDVGELLEDESSIAITLSQYVVYNEEEVEKSGLLGDMTWEQFKEANKTPVALEVDESIVQLFRDATLEKCTVLAFREPVFYDKTEGGRTFTDWLPIILAVVILGMLGFVVWRSLRPVEVTEVDTGISVDELLTATQEAQSVAEIDVNEKSEVRKAIEKFIDDNPESAALLLRNWLNEEWK